MLVRRKLVLKLVSGHFYYYITQPLVSNVSFTHLNYDSSSLQQYKVTEHHKEEVKKKKRGCNLLLKELDFVLPMLLSKVQ